MTRLSRRQRRPAAHLVEAAVVLPLILMLLFGILEYGRLVMTLQMLENAAREGARFAVAHTSDADTAAVIARVNQKMAGLNTKLPGYTVSVSAIILRPQAGETAGTALTDWTNASTTDGIVVEITASFKPLVSSLTGLGAIPLRAKSVMYSEGN